jgi:hypothetical protein
MALQQINIGTTANDGAGDPLRTAFNKINQNFIELYTGLPALGIGATPPISPVQGQQWWDTQDGNSYIYYNNNWVPSTSTVSLQSNNVRSAVGNVITVNFSQDGIITSSLTGSLTISFVNYTPGIKIRVILPSTSLSYVVTHGLPAAQSSNGSTTVTAGVVPSTIILEYTCTGTNLASVFVKV